MSEKTYSLEMTIRSLLGNKRYSTIKDILITLNAADIAAIFAELEPDMLPLLFRFVQSDNIIKVASYGRDLFIYKTKHCVL